MLKKKPDVNSALDTALPISITNKITPLKMSEAAEIKSLLDQIDAVKVRAEPPPILSLREVALIPSFF